MPFWTYCDDGWFVNCEETKGCKPYWGTGQLSQKGAQLFNKRNSSMNMYHVAHRMAHRMVN